MMKNNGRMKVTSIVSCKIDIFAENEWNQPRKDIGEVNPDLWRNHSSLELCPIHGCTHKNQAQLFWTENFLVKTVIIKKKI